MPHIEKQIGEKQFHNREAESVSSLIPHQLRDVSSNLILLLEDYYKYLNQKGQPTNIIDRISYEHDLDTVDDQFLDQIRNEFAKGIPESSVLTNRQLYRRLVDYYYSRGSITSADTFFNLFFDDDVTLTFPKETLHKPSHGTLKKHGFIENDSTRVDYSNVSGDFLTPKDTSAQSGFKSIRTRDGIDRHGHPESFVGEILYEFDRVSERYYAKNNNYQYYYYDRGQQRWTFVRQAGTQMWAFDTSGATEEAGWWSIERNKACWVGWEFSSSTDLSGVYGSDTSSGTMDGGRTSFAQVNGATTNSTNVTVNGQQPGTTKRPIEVGMFVHGPDITRNDVSVVSINGGDIVLSHAQSLPDDSELYFSKVLDGVGDMVTAKVVSGVTNSNTVDVSFDKLYFVGTGRIYMRVTGNGINGYVYVTAVAATSGTNSSANKLQTLTLSGKVTLTTNQTIHFGVVQKNLRPSLRFSVAADGVINTPSFLINAHEDQVGKDDIDDSRKNFYAQILSGATKFNEVVQVVDTSGTPYTANHTIELSKSVTLPKDTELTLCVPRVTNALNSLSSTAGLAGGRIAVSETVPLRPEHENEYIVNYGHYEAAFWKFPMPSADKDISQVYGHIPSTHEDYDKNAQTHFSYLSFDGTGHVGNRSHLAAKPGTTGSIDEMVDVSTMFNENYDLDTVTTLGVDKMGGKITLGTFEGNTKVYRTDISTGKTSLYYDAEQYPYRKIVQPNHGDKIFADKPIGMTAAGRDHFVMHLNSYGKLFGFHNERGGGGEDGPNFSGYALENAEIDFYEIDAGVDHNFDGRQHDWTMARSFPFEGPLARPQNYVLGPSNLQGGRKQPQMYEVVVGGNYSSVINASTGIIIRNGKHLDPSTHRTKLIPGDRFIAQPTSPQGIQYLFNGLKVKAAPALTKKVKAGQFFTISSRQNNSTITFTKTMFVIKSTGNIILAASGEFDTTPSPDQAEDNIQLMPMTDKAFVREGSTSDNYALNGVGGEINFQGGSAKIAAARLLSTGFVELDLERSAAHTGLDRRGLDYINVTGLTFGTASSVQFYTNGVTNESDIITLKETPSGISVGMVISGPGVPSSVRVVAINTTTKEITINKKVTLKHNILLSFGGNSNVSTAVRASINMASDAVDVTTIVLDSKIGTIAIGDKVTAPGFPENVTVTSIGSQSSTQATVTVSESVYAQNNTRINFGNPALDTNPNGFHGPVRVNENVYGYVNGTTSSSTTVVLDNMRTDNELRPGMKLFFPKEPAIEDTFPEHGTITIVSVNAGGKFGDTTATITISTALSIANNTLIYFGPYTVRYPLFKNYAQINQNKTNQAVMSLKNQTGLLLKGAEIRAPAFYTDSNRHGSNVLIINRVNSSAGTFNAGTAIPIDTKLGKHNIVGLTVFADGTSSGGYLPSNSLPPNFKADKKLGKVTAATSNTVTLDTNVTLANNTYLFYYFVPSGHWRAGTAPKVNTIVGDTVISITGGSQPTQTIDMSVVFEGGLEPNSTRGNALVAEEYGLNPDLDDRPLYGRIHAKDTRSSYYLDNFGADLTTAQMREKDDTKFFALKFGDGFGTDVTGHVPLELCKDTYVIPKPLRDWTAMSTYVNKWDVSFWRERDNKWITFESVSRPNPSRLEVQANFKPAVGSIGGNQDFLTDTGVTGAAKAGTVQTASLSGTLTGRSGSIRAGMRIEQPEMTGTLQGSYASGSTGAAGQNITIDNVIAGLTPVVGQYLNRAAGGGGGGIPNDTKIATISSFNTSTRVLVCTLDKAIQTTDNLAITFNSELSRKGRNQSAGATTTHNRVIVKSVPTATSFTLFPSDLLTNFDIPLNLPLIFTSEPNLWKFEGDKPFALWTNDELEDEEVVHGYNRNTYNVPQYNFFSDYEDRKGFLSDVNKIHDGDFNQEFSYGINTAISTERWVSQYKKLVHPSGTKLFGLLQVEGENLRKVGEKGEGNSIYNVSQSDEWLSNLYLDVGQHSPTFQPGVLDLATEAEVVIEPFINSGASVVANDLAQILGSIYTLTTPMTNGVVNEVKLETQFVGTTTPIDIITTNLTNTFVKPQEIYNSENLEDSGIGNDAINSTTRRSLPNTIDYRILADGSMVAAPSGNTYQARPIQINAGTDASISFSGGDGADHIIEISIPSGEGTVSSPKTAAIRIYGLHQGRKYKVTGEAAITTNTLQTGKAARIGVDISDGYVNEQGVSSNREQFVPAKGMFKLDAPTSGTRTVAFTPFEVTGTYSNNGVINGGRLNIDGQHDFVDIFAQITTTPFIGAFTAQFKNLKVEEFYEQEVITFGPVVFDTAQPLNVSGAETTRSDSRTNIVNWNSPISNKASDTFLDYQLNFDIPVGAVLKARARQTDNDVGKPTPVPLNGKNIANDNLTHATVIESTFTIT